MRNRLPISLIVVFAVSVLLWAAGDPLNGTWKTNVAKSKYSPGPPPGGFSILKFEISGDEEKYDSQQFDGQGKITGHVQYIAKYDGKDYPQERLAGNSTVDTVVIKRIDAYTSERVEKSGGKVVSTLRRVVSKDGKSFTTTRKGTNAQGQPVNNVVVYEKQ